MTLKLFYQDTYQTSFEAEVVECKKHQEAYAVRLNQTAFYPEGGGQPSDKGTIDDSIVNEVFVKDEHIYHVTQKAIEVGKKVKGNIDFARRFDYMQQHSAEHIVSGIIKAFYGYDNVGFHLSENTMTADINGILTQEELERVEQVANEAVFANIPVESCIYCAQELEKMPYRSKIDLQGDVRIVSIKGYDTCACCGTHVGATGEIGMIKIVTAEKYKSGMRLSLLCGRRLLKDYHNKLKMTKTLSEMLSAKPEVIVDAVCKQQEDSSKLKQKLSLRTKELFIFKSAHYLQKNQLEKIVCIVEEDLSADELRRFCNVLIEQSSKTCLVLTPDGDGFKYALGNSQKEIRDFNTAFNKALGGKGGGKDIYQGSIKAAYEAVIQFLQQIDQTLV